MRADLAVVCEPDYWRFGMTCTTNRDEVVSMLHEPERSTRMIRRFLGIADDEFIELTAFCFNKPWVAQCSNIETHVGLLETAETLRGYNGSYILLNGPLNPELGARYDQDCWVPAWNSRASDRDIRKRRAVFIDIDPIRPKGISATNDEQRAAWEVTNRIHNYFIEKIGEATIGWGSSGNGYFLLIAIEPVANPADYTEPINRLLKLLHRKFGTEQVSIDTSVANPARLMCAPGTWKRKGRSTPERPHRLTTFRCSFDEATGEIARVPIGALIP